MNDHFMQFAKSDVDNPKSNELLSDIPYDAY